RHGVLQPGPEALSGAAAVAALLSLQPGAHGAGGVVDGTGGRGRRRLVAVARPEAAPGSVRVRRCLQREAEVEFELVAARPLPQQLDASDDLVDAPGAGQGEVLPGLLRDQGQV